MIKDDKIYKKKGKDNKMNKEQEESR